MNSRSLPYLTRVQRLMMMMRRRRRRRVEVRKKFETTML